MLTGFTLLIGASPIIQAASPIRERIAFNNDWLFHYGDPADVGDKLSHKTAQAALFPQRLPFLKTPPASAPKSETNLGGDISFVQPAFDHTSWRSLTLPHDWGVEGEFKQDYNGETGKLAWWGQAWYRKSFKLSESDPSTRYYLDIDGAMSHSLVWINGRFVGGWPYGYSSFRVDLSAHINRTGVNTIAIRLNNPEKSSRWYPGGGIYRNVWLVKTASVHVGQWGVTVTTPEVSAASATVAVAATVRNTLASPAAVTIRTEVFALDTKGNRIGRALDSHTSESISVAASSNATTSASLVVPQPKLWSPASPNRYVAITRVVQDRKVVDEYETPFGIRTVKFDAARGLLLNGKLVEIHGVCNHHDLGALGSAINTRAIERQIEILQEMGCNAIRTSHNPPAPELLELCDRMGMLVQVEAFDCWSSGKNPNDYGRDFYAWNEADLRTMVRRDRNHPSVIMWSTGNEIHEQSGPELSAKLAAIIREEDPSRPVTVGCNWNEAGFNGFQKSVDVFGYNYKTGSYGRFLKENPGIPLHGSETASTVSSRGEYFFPINGDGKSDFQMSSYDLYYPGWATTPDTEFKYQDQNPAVAGEFVWTGFDYLGEPTPYNKDATNLLNMADPVARARLKDELDKLGKIQVPSRSSYFGIIDLAGFKKDRFYLYQARWRPELPMAHILPHWNWPDRVGQITPVHVYTSGDEAELFLNDRSLGRKKKGQYEYRLRWDTVKYEPGTLKVVAYKNGQPWADATTRTTGAAAKLTVSADRVQLAADGRDLAFVTVSVVDKDGTVVPRSKQSLRFEVTGPAEIVATDNGDPTDHTAFKSTTRNAFNGLALVIVRTQPGQSGKITVKAASDGLAAGETTLQSR